MSKFKRRTIFVEAFQWFKHGDVKEVTTVPFSEKISDSKRKSVGWLATPEGGHTIFPGDWVIIDHRGRISSCNPLTFTKLYEGAEDPVLNSQYGQGKSA